MVATTAAAYRAVRRKDYDKHRRYMPYSFATVQSNMTGPYVAIALRLLGISVDPTYIFEGAKWVPWVGTLMLDQWWLYRTARRPSARVERGQGSPACPKSDDRSRRGVS